LSPPPFDPPLDSSSEHPTTTSAKTPKAAHFKPADGFQLTNVDALMVVSSGGSGSRPDNVPRQPEKGSALVGFFLIFRWAR
jgi:hypothetical protein